MFKRKPCKPHKTFASRVNDALLLTFLFAYLTIGPILLVAALA